jgi:hypothetical protein
LILEFAADCLLLLGVSRHPRRLGAAVVLSSQLEIVGALTKCCKGFLILSRGSSRIGYSSGARGLEDPHLVCGCATPAEGSTLDSRLTHEPTSGCIDITGSSLPGRSEPRDKFLCRSFLEDFSCVID